MVEEKGLANLILKFYIRGKDIVFSLILGPDICRDLRGFCLLIFIKILADYQQKNPLNTIYFPDFMKQ